MAKINTKKVGTDRRFDKEGVRLAGGGGLLAAAQGAEGQLRRAVLSCLLWEDVAYQTGEGLAAEIKALVPQVPADRVAALAIEARTKSKLRHVPLYLARVMAALSTHKQVVGSLLPEIILRPDELTEFLAIYQKDGGKDQPISAQVKKGLAAAFARFNEYQLAKYNRDGDVKLRDVLFLTHPAPEGGIGNTKRERKMGKYDTTPRADLYRRLVRNELATPDTWEVALSAGADKKATWTRLINEGKLGALAFVRNLRNMEQAGVDPKVIREGFGRVNTQWLLPLNMVAAAKHAPTWERELEGLMLRCLADQPKLKGRTILVIDSSGSMSASISSKSELNRLDAALSLAMLASEVCESVAIYMTAGGSEHATALIKPRRGFALLEDAKKAAQPLGGGGIFTRQALEYIKTQEREKPDRIMVFSDSQDCDRTDKVPAPFGEHNYIIDIGAHTRGVNFAGVWDAEIAGFSPNFLSYIAALEGQAIGVTENDESDSAGGN